MFKAIFSKVNKVVLFIFLLVILFVIYLLIINAIWGRDVVVDSPKLLEESIKWGAGLFSAIISFVLSNINEKKKNETKSRALKDIIKTSLITIIPELKRMNLFAFPNMDTGDVGSLRDKQQIIEDIIGLAQDISSKMNDIYHSIDSVGVEVRACDIEYYSYFSRLRVSLEQFSKVKDQEHFFLLKQDISSIIKLTIEGE
jgi:hypothetical protein